MISFLKQLLFFNSRKKIKSRFNRILPSGDYIFDRWEKARFAGFGEGTSVYDSCLILGDVKVGKNCWIGPYTILDGSGHGLEIGDNCNISSGVHIYTHDTTKTVLYGKSIQQAPVKIGNNVYIGPNSIISMGVTIANFVVIGTQSFVNRDIPDWHKAYGTPAKIFPITQEEQNQQ
ncbi:MAG: acyltransferase [Leptospiraceae bacterium]|nr:acyltransferase [Leptospiraceae bacterium]